VAPVPGAALEPPPGNPRFPLFDGLRALAAMSVLTFHVAYWSHMDIGTAGLSPYTARLNVGVTIFFLISGFLLYRPFLAGRTGDGPPVRLLDYARRRVVRIVPAYWVALTLFGLYPGLPDLFSSRWWVYYGFGQDYGKWTVLAGLDVAWTLGCEVFFYIVLPLFALSFAWLAGRLGRRLWWQFEVAVLGVLIAASTAFYVYAATHPRRISPAEPGATFSWFALGMLLAMASLWLERRGGKLLESLRRYAWTGWLVALVAYVVICRGLGLYSGPPFKELDSPLQTFAVYALDGVVAVGVALPAVFERRPQSAIGRALAWRPLAWLGLISYGVYLYHNVLLTTFAGHFQLGSSVTEKFLSMLVACAFLAILAGALSYYIVERPILRLKENPLVKLRIRRAPPPSPAVAQDPVAVTPFAPGSRSSMSAAPEPPGPS
jgi:peptidoglycan/LPS O-acetylase OafA/YrhL